MWKKEMSRLLDERAERIVALEQRLEKSSAIIETYRAREQTIIDSLTSSQAEARQRIADAEAKADELIGNARVIAENATQAAEASANEIVARAENYRDELLQSAKTQADEMLLSAREKSSSMLAQTQAAVAEYRETLERYNAIIEESAAHAKIRAEQYATFLSTHVLSAPEFTKTAENLSEAPYVAPVALPDVEDNPAQLMRNIYTLEKRDIPEEAAECPAYPMSADEPEAPAEPLLATPQTAEAPEEMPDLAPHPIEEPETPAEPLPAAPQIAEEPEEMPDLAPHPIEEPETPSEPLPAAPQIAEEPEEMPDLAPHPVEEPEEMPDLAPRPEPVEWRPEDEAAEPEWQPEEDETAMPTVSGLTSEHPVDDEVEMSLDALLDEIIHAGE